MKSIKLYILWKDGEGHLFRRIYLDKASAEIALCEHFTDEEIKDGIAKIEQIPAVSYADSFVKKE